MTLPPKDEEEPVDRVREPAPYNCTPPTAVMDLDTETENSDTTRQLKHVRLETETGETGVDGDVPRLAMTRAESGKTDGAVSTDEENPRTTPNTEPDSAISVANVALAALILMIAAELLIRVTEPHGMSAVEAQPVMDPRAMREPKTVIAADVMLAHPPARMNELVASTERTEPILVIRTEPEDCTREAEETLIKHDDAPVVCKVPEASTLKEELLDTNKEPSD